MCVRRECDNSLKDCKILVQVHLWQRALMLQTSASVQKPQALTLPCMPIQVFAEVEKAMDSLPSQQGSKGSNQISDSVATHAQGAGQLAAA